MNYAELVKKLRQKLVLSQTEMAAYLGTSFESVNRWENNRNEPTIKMKRKIIVLCKRNGIEIEVID